ncbi:MAG: lysophospholipid acyltransferase family protein [Actinomycetes bacterium]
MADRVYRSVVRTALGTFRALDLRLDIAGEEHVPAASGGVVVINHIGYLDFALAGVPFWRAQRRLVRFMAKQEVFTHRVGGPLMRAMHHIPVDRSAGTASFRAAMEALRGGELVGVFPEATISRSFCLKEFKSGAVRMARSARVPVLPMALWGSQRVFTKDRKPSLRAARHTPICITLGPPIDPRGSDDPDAELLATMNGLLEASRARYPDPPGDDPWWVPAHLGGTAPTPERAAEMDAEEQRARAERRAAQGEQR